MGNSQTAAASSGASDITISHFIPSVELRGSRNEQLAMLETLIEHLEQLKVRLSVDAGATTRSRTRPSRYLERPSWPWFVSGTGAGALFVVLLLIARSCA